jgi:dienelactone hydrolase
MQWIQWFQRASLLSFVAITTACTTATVISENHNSVTHLLYPPATGKGRVVVVLSGYTGTRFYQDYATALAREGYYAVLLDGKDFPPRHPQGEANLRRVIERLPQTQGALPGRVAVVGFSFGGGGALVYAARMPDVVAAVVTYYPSTTFITDHREVASKFQVPILVLTGEKDFYNGCCLAETARTIENAAKEQQKNFTLITYPDAGHGFNLAIPAYRAVDTDDAWTRTLAMLRQYLRD